jgi:hypothetical protein
MIKERAHLDRHLVLRHLLVLPEVHVPASIEKQRVGCRLDKEQDDGRDGNGDEIGNPLEASFLSHYEEPEGKLEYDYGKHRAVGTHGRQ